MDMRDVSKIMHAGVEIQKVMNGGQTVWPLLSWDGNYRNLALEGSATASSYRQAGEEPSKAIDGNKVSDSSRWMAQNDPAPWLIVDLGGLCLIDKIMFYSGYNVPNTSGAVADYKFEHWNGATWVTIVEVSGSAAYEKIHTFSELETTKVRLSMPNSGDGGYQRVFEVEIYGQKEV